MGGMLKAITPSSPKSSQTQSQSPPPAQPQTAAAAAAVTEAAQTQHRQEALTRVRAGRAGTIATSSRGLLTAAEWMPTRKSLLGE